MYVLLSDPGLALLQECGLVVNLQCLCIHKALTVHLLIWESSDSCTLCVVFMAVVRVKIFSKLDANLE